MAGDFDDATEQHEGVFDEQTDFDIGRFAQAGTDAAAETAAHELTATLAAPRAEDVATIQRKAPDEAQAALPSTVIRRLDPLERAARAERRGAGAPEGEEPLRTDAEPEEAPPAARDERSPSSASADAAPAGAAPADAVTAVTVRASGSARRRGLFSAVAILAAIAIALLGSLALFLLETPPARPRPYELATDPPARSAAGEADELAPLAEAPPLPEAAALVIEGRFAEAARAYAALAREAPDRPELATMARILRQKARR